MVGSVLFLWDGGFKEIGNREQEWPGRRPDNAQRMVSPVARFRGRKKAASENAGFPRLNQWRGKNGVEVHSCSEPRQDFGGFNQWPPESVSMARQQMAAGPAGAERTESKYETCREVRQGLWGLESVAPKVRLKKRQQLTAGSTGAAAVDSRFHRRGSS